MALVVKNLLANIGHPRDAGSIPGLRRSLGGRHGNSLQYSSLGNPMDRGAWQATVQRVSKSDTHLKRLSMHTTRTREQSFNFLFPTTTCDWIAKTYQNFENSYSPENRNQMTIRKKKKKKRKKFTETRRNRTGQKKYNIFRYLWVIASERTFYTWERKNL